MTKLFDAPSACSVFQFSNSRPRSLTPQRVKVEATCAGRFCSRAWGLPHSRKQRGGGDAGRIPSPTAVCAREKHRRGSSPRGPEILRRPAHGDARPVSHDPRWTHRTIHRWRTFSACSTCVGTRSTQCRQGRPCDARQARRNHATSAAALRLSRKKRNAATVSGPHRATRRAMPCIRAGTSAIYFCAEGVGKSFFEDSRKGLSRKGKVASARNGFPRFNDLA
jgi:hypothetical protein